LGELRLYCPKKETLFRQRYKIILTNANGVFQIGVFGTLTFEEKNVKNFLKIHFSYKGIVEKKL
jgi:hypothetical protein